MPAQFNWINHTLAETPSILTAEDMQAVDDDRIDQFHVAVKTLLLLRNESIPNELIQELRHRPAMELLTILHQVLVSGQYMDTGWYDEYYSIADEISQNMRGYPRSLKQKAGQVPDCVPSSLPSLDTDGGNQIMDYEPSNPLRQFNFLELPEKIRTSIYRYLLLRKTIAIGDWAIGAGPVDSLHRQTEYNVFDRKSKRLRRTTYTVRIEGGNPTIYLGIMLTRKQIYKECLNIFYSENTFSFRGTGESTLAFIHDRPGRLKTLRKVEMKFTCDPYGSFIGCYNSTCPIPAGPNTYIGAWRRIFNFFVHCSIGLEDFKLILDEEFWIVADWEGEDVSAAAQRVYTALNLCEARASPPDPAGRVPRNFLEHVARLGGINVLLDMAGSDVSPERRKFRLALLKLIQLEAKKRPHLADDEEPVCNCNRRLLSESCIWDKEGKMRRFQTQSSVY